MTGDYLIRNPFTGFPSTKITAEFWAKTTGASDGMISYATNTIGSAANDFLLIVQNSLNIFINNNSRGVGINIANGLFHYVVITWDSTNGGVTAYLDGVLIHSSIGHRIGDTT